MKVYLDYDPCSMILFLDFVRKEVGKIKGGIRNKRL